MNRAERNSLVALPMALGAGLAMAWAGGANGAIAAGLPVFGWCAALAFGLNALVFVPAYLSQSERFYDLTGSLTYLCVVSLALGLSGAPSSRAWLLAGLVSLWTTRLGTFLVKRIRAEGSDTRFDGIKPSFLRFGLAWILQGLWVLLTSGAALAAIATSSPQPLGLYALAGAALWISGFALEVQADREKQRFRRAPANRGRFIQSGVWSWSRHPNYFGEIVLWVGIAIIAWPVLRGWPLATLISPVFVAFLLTRVSGIPILERRGLERWGDDPNYHSYLAYTPALIPWPPGFPGGTSRARGAERSR